MRRALVLCLAMAQPVQAEPLERFGTAMKYALPLTGAVCAADQDRLEDYAARAVVQAGLVWGLKRIFDGTGLGRRPSGGAQGFPSGHSALAGFGAADLAGKCFRDEPALGAAAYGAAGLTAFSRVQAGEHTPAQAIGGAMIGIGFGAASFGVGSQGAALQFGLRF